MRTFIKRFWCWCCPGWQLSSVLPVPSWWFCQDCANEFLLWSRQEPLHRKICLGDEAEMKIVFLAWKRYVLSEGRQ